MRLSRKKVTSATHAVPEIHFEEQELTSFGGLLVFQRLFNELDLRSRLRTTVRHLPDDAGGASDREPPRREGARLHPSETCSVQQLQRLTDRRNGGPYGASIYVTGPARRPCHRL